MESSQSILSNCYHCNDLIENDPISHEDKEFCCEGCKTVYSILEKQDLCEYYDLDKEPGINPGKVESDRFNYLLDHELAAQLLDYHSEKLAKITLEVPKMHCISCIWLLEKLYRFEPGILESRVNFPAKELLVSFDPKKTDLRNIVFLLSSLGYEPELSAASKDRKKPRSINRKLWIQIGIAGFSFGNIMLLSITEYLDFLSQLGSDFRNSFGLISFFLALPVLIYSDLDYFRSAIGGVRKRVLNLDVPLSLGMISLFVFSSFEVFLNNGLGYFDSFAGLVFFLLIGKAFQEGTINYISFDRDYRSFFPLYANRIKAGKKETIPLDKLEIGDRILIPHQGLIPADGYLLKGSAEIDYSFVTGESIPSVRGLGEVLYAGGKQTGSAIELELKKLPSTSYLTSLWDSKNAKNPSSPLLRLNDLAGKYFTIGVILIASLGFALWLPDLGKAFSVFSSVLIIACPCALALSAPFAFGNGMRILSRLGFFLKNTQALESLSKIDYIIFDKTGTLTDQKNVEVNYEGELSKPEDFSKVLSLTSQSTHPLSKVVSGAIHEPSLPVKDFKEVLGMGISGRVENTFIKIGKSEWTGANSKEPGVFVSFNGENKGRFIIEGSLRQNIKGMLKALPEDYKLAICSGDNEASWKGWKEIFPKGSRLRFNCNPLQKAEEVEKQIKEGRKVAMIGDGLNDGIALQKSHVGLAYAQDKEYFTPASDGIISEGNLGQLNRILQFAKDCRRVVLISFIISLSYNIIGLSVALAGNLSPVFAAILMPLSSITVVIFAVFSTGILSRYRELKKMA